MGLTAALRGTLRNLPAPSIKTALILGVTVTVMSVNFFQAGYELLTKKLLDPSYSPLYQELMDWADKDMNRVVSIEEQADAWRRMGYKGPFLESKGAAQFPTPSLEQLAAGVESYRSSLSDSHR